MNVLSDSYIAHQQNHSNNPINNNVSNSKVVNSNSNNATVIIEEKN